MSTCTTYEERLASFISWPHSPPTPQPADLAAAGFIHEPSHCKYDQVQCPVCRIELNEWEPNDNAVLEHINYSPECSAVISDNSVDGSPATSKSAASSLRGPKKTQLSNGDHCYSKRGVADNKANNEAENEADSERTQLTPLSSGNTTAPLICSVIPASASEILTPMSITSLTSDGTAAPGTCSTDPVSASKISISTTELSSGNTTAPLICSVISASASEILTPVSITPLANLSSTPPAISPRIELSQNSTAAAPICSKDSVSTSESPATSPPAYQILQRNSHSIDQGDNTNKYDLPLFSNLEKTISIDIIAEANKTDTLCSNIRTAIAKGQVKYQGVTLSKCSVHDNILYRQGRLWVPERYQTELIREIHADHSNAARIYEYIKQKYYWRKMQTMITQYVEYLAPLREESPATSKSAASPLRGPEKAQLSNGDHCYSKGGIADKADKADKADQADKAHNKADNKRTPLSSRNTTTPSICSANTISASEISVTSVTPLASTPATPPPTYRAISPEPPAYQSIKPRGYLTMDDLFMRYAPLKRIKSGLVVRPTSKILPTMTIQDLYLRFEKQEKQWENSVLAHIKPQPNISVSRPYPAVSSQQRSKQQEKQSEKQSEKQVQHRADIYAIKYSDPTVKSNAKTSYLTTSNSNALLSISQSQRHITSIKHAPKAYPVINNHRGPAPWS